MIPGFHIHLQKAAKMTYISAPFPDPRLNLVKMFTLSESIGTTINHDSGSKKTGRLTLEDERRFLKIGNELVTYENYTTYSSLSVFRFAKGENWALLSKMWTKDLNSDYWM